MAKPTSFGLTEETYEWLRQHPAPETKQDTWYKITYPVFIKQKFPENKEEFCRLMALVYSWMPRIPTITDINDKEWTELLANLKKLNNDDSVLESLLYQLIPVVNNSVVGSSKILHVLYPSLIPIIDMGVIENWNFIFKENKDLVLSKTYLNSSDVQKKVVLFIKYRKKILIWKENCRPEISIRHVESALFNFQPG
jgi:hypothetical protein